MIVDSRDYNTWSSENMVYMYQSVTKYFANAVLNIKEEHSGMTYPTIYKGSGSLKSFKPNHRFFIG